MRFLTISRPKFLLFTQIYFYNFIIIVSSSTSSFKSSHLDFSSTKSWASSFPHYKNAPIKSQLDLISTLSIIGHESSARNPNLHLFLCDTWIFSWSKSKNYQPYSKQIDSFSNSASSMSYLDQVPMAHLEATGNESSTITFAYSRPFKEQDLLKSHIFGFQQKTHNFHCAMIDTSFITDSNEAIQAGIDNSMALILKKYARPHKDYFIYLTNQLSTLQEIYTGNVQLTEIRFRYGFIFSQAETPTQVKNERLQFLNICERPNEVIPWFSRKCFPHISNRHYSVVCTSIKPFLHFDDSTDDSPENINKVYDKPAGVMFSIFAEAGSRYNYTFDIEYSSYLGASGFNINGTWYGAVGQIFSKQKHIAFGVVPSVHRFPVVEPIFVTWMIRFFYIRSPPYVTSWKAAFLSLNPEIWALTGFTVLFLVIPVYYISAVLYFKTRTENDIDDASSTIIKNRTPDYILGDLIDALNRILMEQSATVRHWTGTRIRLLILLWTAFCLILGTAYRAKLINFLTFLEQEHVPLTHMELSLNNDYKLFLRYMGGTAYRFMIESEQPMHKRIMKRAVLVNTSAETMFHALFEEKSAWLDYRINAEFAMQENATLHPSLKLTPIFTRSKDTDYTGNFGWIFAKGSPIAESFHYILGSTFNAGLYDEWINKNSYKIRVKSARYLKSLPSSPVRDKIEKVMESLITGPKALNNASFLGIYFVCLFGCGLGFISWIGENVEFYGRRYVREKDLVRKRIVPVIWWLLKKVKIEKKPQRALKA